MKNSIYGRLKEVKVINTHEHLWDEAYRLEHPGDWTSLFFHYGATVLETAGLSLKERDELFADTTPHDRKWEIFSRCFPYAKYTAYIKSVLIAIKDIYGIDTVDSDTMRELTQKMREAVKPGFHRRILREKANIDYCMVNSFDRDSEGYRYPARTWGDTDLLRPDIMADSFIFPSDIPLIRKLTGEDCSTFSSWIKAVDTYFEENAAQACSIKIALGYRGPLDFKRGVSFETAEKFFNEKITTNKDDYPNQRPLVDYMFYYVMGKAREYCLPLKFHTGIYAAANNVHMDHIEGNIKHLSRIAMENNDVNFIAMHIAYPFQDQLAMALKSMTNLYADMSWAWIVDTAASADFLRKALSTAPVNKVTGFGGDYSWVENTYGHLEIARRAIAGVLADMAEDGSIDTSEACFIGEQLLRGSAERLYKK